MSEQLLDTDIITYEDDTTSDGYFVNEAINVILRGNNQLLLFYILLRQNHNLQLKGLSTQGTYDFMCISRNTFYKYQKQLADLGLITIKKRYAAKSTITFNKIRLPDKPKNIVGTAAKIKWLDRMQQKLIDMYSPDKIKANLEKQKMEQATLLVEEKAKEIVQKKEAAKKKEEQRFDARWYDMVLTAYSKHKGIGLKGPEVLRAKHAIKQMFLAERTPKEIIDCMAFFEKMDGNEEYFWLKHWTLETVMKKIPEFVAGKMKKRDISDDLPNYADIVKKKS